MCLTCSDNRTHELTDATGRTWRFEWHHFCGPMVLRADGEPRSRQPGERSSFWPALDEWSKVHRPATGAGA